MLKNICFIFYLLCLPNFLCAQTTTLKGLVQDSLTKTPISHVGIGISNTSIGTVTSETGKFNLTAITKASDTLLVTLMGYKTQKILIASLQNKHNIVILLAQSREILGEITLSKKYDITDLIQEAVDSIPANYYEKETVYLKGFYHEIHQYQNEPNPTKQVEAYTTTKRPSIKSKELAQVIVEKARKESKNMNPQYIGNDLFLDVIDKDMLPDALNKRKFKYFDYTLHGIRTHKGLPCYYITSQRKQTPHVSEIWIDTTTLAFVKLAYQRSYETEKYSGYSTPLYKLFRNPLYLSHAITYKQHNNKQWYLDTVEVYSKEMERIGKDTIHIKFHYQVTQTSNEYTSNPNSRILGEKGIVEHYAMLWDDPAWWEKKDVNPQKKSKK